MSRADVHSTGPGAPAMEVSRMHVGKKWTQSLSPGVRQEVSEGADPDRKPCLLRPRTEFQYREEAKVFVKSGPHPPICETSSSLT